MANPNVITIRINGEPIAVDVKSVTIRERARAMARLKADPELDPQDELTLTAAVAWVCARRHHPDLELDDVLDSMTLGDLMDSAAEDPNSPEA